MNFSDQELCRCGALSADQILAKAFGVSVEKALDPLDNDDFLVIVGRLTRSLMKATKEQEAAVLNRAIKSLDVDWANMTGTERDRVVEAARIAVGKAPRRFIKPIQKELRVTGTRVTKNTKRRTKQRVGARVGGRINVDLSLRDKRTVNHLVNSQALFIRDEWGRRSARFSTLARTIVGEGLEEGLGRDSIAENLDRRLRAAVGLEKSKNYWNIISSVFTNRSRVWGSLASMDEAAIQRFIFSAVMDEVTTDQCRTLNGRVFEVQAGLSKYNEVEANDDPESVKDVMPWIRTGSDGQGGKFLFVQTRAGRRTVLGEVVRSGVGNRDDPGQVRGMPSSTQLQAIGAFMPPLHGRCRSTIEPDV